MAHQRAAFDFTPTPEEERATMRKILAHLAPKTKDDVQMIAAALKTHGPKFEDIFLEWATPYGRYKAKGLWERTKADPDAITEVIERQLAAESRNKRFEALPVYALEALPSLRWCIKSVFPSVGVVAVYGPSGSGKSFLAISIAASIAEGSPFFGHVTRPAAVLYVGLEGEGGYKGRVIAWQRIKGRTMADGVAFILQPFCLTNPQDVADLAAICPAGCVVIIDTLNRASPGMDENSSRDMGAAIDGAKMLQQLVAGLVVLIAHTGKDSTRGLRGHSSLFAALDAAILVSREGDVRSWKVDKAKDGKDGEIHRFVLQTVDVGTDEDGDVITSRHVAAHNPRKAADHQSEVGAPILPRSCIGPWRYRRTGKFSRVASAQLATGILSLEFRRLRYGEEKGLRACAERFDRARSACCRKQRLSTCGRRIGPCRTVHRRSAENHPRHYDTTATTQRHVACHIIPFGGRQRQHTFRCVARPRRYDQQSVCNPRPYVGNKIGEVIP